MKSLLVLAVLFLATSGWAQGSYDVETVEVSAKGTRASQEDLADLYNGPSEETSIKKQSAPEPEDIFPGDSGKEIVPLSQRSSLRSAYEVYGYDSALEMRSRRRVGIGGSTSGHLGLLGVMVEFNLTPENSAVLGFGGGSKYNAFSAQWKHLFGGRNFTPYATLAYSRWYNNSENGGIGSTMPTALGSKFLTEEEKRSGKFSVNLVSPALGIQLNQLVGKYTGTAVFAEVVLLTHIKDFEMAPTGSLGALYYF